ncbi:NUDIX hydrolase [Desulfomonile tiedjei]|uniref:Isopentenyldiphosphate isomerase n=1 Tax=Desulfomonile tiedjei (strain ATCC 49306 / DSM 6799 / DCB-1) TaxID=706587 RepID=I4C9N7_DESTA|nr:NUDIX domain-containing protein [Desulfomonile tiedjei]AFM26278.1 isopentenyldiphosphate isomerase [Desulfomonile tiedjei DSM 6799]
MTTANKNGTKTKHDSSAPQYSTDREILEIVDAKDRVIGTATRAEIHRLGLIHRSVHIFIFNSAGELYMQRRSPAKDRHPSKLDSSAAGHVDPGETYQQTAARELGEELGITCDLQEILRVHACPETDNEHVVLFAGTTDREPKPDPDEIQWGAFMKTEDVCSLMKQNPKDFVPAFILLWNRFERKSG